jgi:hypothetical protein
MLFSQASFYGRCGAVAGAIALLASCGGGGGGSNGGRFFFPTAAPAQPVTPVAEQRAIGGTVTGLVGKLVLQNNAGDDLTLTADGKFGFAGTVATGSDYAVSVRNQPYWQFCTVTKGSGTVTAEVGDVAVTCAEAAAQVSTFVGTGSPASLDGNRDTATFDNPMGVIVGKNGELFVSEPGSNRMRKVAANGDVSTFAGNNTAGTIDGNATAASFNGLIAMALAPSGDFYGAEFGGNVIRKITQTADVSVFAGAGSPGSGDGNAATATFNGPIAMTIDGAGNIFLAELHVSLIRKITPAGDVSTLAGSSPLGFADGTGTAAQFARPYGIVADAAGNLFVADSENHRIRKVTQGGVVTTFAGTGTPGSLDGAKDIATFQRPGGLAFDALGNLYVADTDNNVLRKITPAGVVSTVAGKAGVMGSQNGIREAARFSQPYGIAIAADGTIYVADSLNHRIRKIEPVAAP